MILEIKAGLTNYLIIPVVCLIGFWLSVQLGFPQFRKLLKALKLVTASRSQGKQTLSAFSAFAAALGGNLGTGNIAGIAVALSLGGPGALFWMWIMAGFGAVLKYGGTYLGVLFRQQTPFGPIGGPMYYMEKGLGNKALAWAFSVAAIASALTVGNFVQVNSLTLPCNLIGINPLILGMILMVLVGYVLLGQQARFVQAVSNIVPLMAVTYLGGCLVILAFNFDQIGSAIRLIFESAFGISQVVGGGVGFSIFAAMSVGFDRGLFATDAGAGLAPILHANAEQNDDIPLPNEHVQGLISMLSPLIVMLICLLTGLVLITTGVWQEGGLESTNMCIMAFTKGMGWQYAGFLVPVILFFFAFTTILTWAYCADRVISYLISPKWAQYFKILFVLLIPIGSVASTSAIWVIADFSLNIMLLANVAAVFMLRKHLLKH